jgi:hypothetical protein
VALVFPVMLLFFLASVAFYYLVIFDPLRNFHDDIQTCQARAEAGEPAFQNNFGYALERGALGLPQDFVRAYMWYNVAASTHPPGEQREGSARNRDRVARRMTTDQIAEAQTLARNWLKLSGDASPGTI